MSKFSNTHDSTLGNLASRVSKDAPVQKKAPHTAHENFLPDLATINEELYKFEERIAGCDEAIACHSDTLRECRERIASTQELIQEIEGDNRTGRPKELEVLQFREAIADLQLAADAAQRRVEGQKRLREHTAHLFAEYREQWDTRRKALEKRARLERKAAKITGKGIVLADRLT